MYITADVHSARRCTHTCTDTHTDTHTGDHRTSCTSLQMYTALDAVHTHAHRHTYR